MHLSKSKAFILFSVLVYVGIFIVLNYPIAKVNSSKINDNYGLTLNAHCYQRVALQSMDFLLEEDNHHFVALLETSNPLIIGIYDPNMDFSTQANQNEEYGMTRYFSMSDYQNKNNVGICVSDCGIGNYPRAEKIGEQTNTEIINIFEGSPLAIDDVKVVKNLFAIEGKLNDYVYLDSYDKQLLNRLDQMMLKHGFEAVENSINVSSSIFEAIRYGINDKYSSYLLLSALFLSLFYIVISYIHYHQLKKDYHINHIYGCNTFEYIKHSVLKLNLIILVIGMVISLILKLVNQDFIIFDLRNYLELLMLCVLYFNAINLLNFWIVNVRGDKS